MNIRIRQLPTGSDDVVSVLQLLNSTGGIDGGWRSVVDISGTQYTESEGHPFPRTRRSMRRRGNIGDVGGPFFTQRRYALLPPVRGLPNGPRYDNKVQRFVGSGVIPIAIPSGYFVTSSPKNPDRAAYPNSDLLYRLPMSVWPTVPSIDLDSLGATAIARCQPTKSLSDLSTTIGELTHDGLPSLVGARAAKGVNPKSLSDEHLNVQFGLKPLISDIQSAARGVASVDSAVEQFRKDSGKLVRRRYRFPVVRKTETTTISSDSPLFAGIVGGWTFRPNGGVIVRERLTVSSVWFSGAFTYTLPSNMKSTGWFSDLNARIDRLGADLDMETVWNLAPWSWAVDWVTNAGDIISNVNAVAKYGLVVQHGYVMAHTRVSDTYYHSKGTIFDAVSGRSLGPLPPVSLVTEEKRRVRASPFGFGVNMSSLSGMQYSILAALGLSRR